MTTPAFLPQDDSTFTPIRYYTAVDPYFYTVDNRPLQDIETNLKNIRSGGGDAARRAAILSTLGLGALANSLYNNGFSVQRGLSGLEAIFVSGTTVRVSPGALYEERAVSASVSDVVTKIGLLTKNQDFTITAPAVAGTSMVYTIEGQYVDLDASNMDTSTLPYLDSSNTYLPSSMMTGELKLSLLAGTPATTGTQVPAATSAGKFPIYNITIAQGAGTYTIAYHSAAPFVRTSLNRPITPTPLTANGATVTQVNDIVTYGFADAVTRGVSIPVSITGMNPYSPIYMRLVFASTVAGGNAVFRLRYRGYGSTELTSAAQVTTTNETIAITGSANAVQVYDTTVAIVSTADFAGWSGSNWSITKSFINIVLERLGSDANDTNTGTINLIDVRLLQ